MRLPINPPSRIDGGAFLGHLCGWLTAGDDFDMSLVFRQNEPNAYLSVPQAAGELGVHFDAIPPVVRLDDHRGSVEPTSPLDLMAPNEDGREGVIGVVIRHA